MASSLSLERISKIVNESGVGETIRSHRAASLTALSFAIIVPFAIYDYRIYLGYGPGGLPYNIGGWLVTNVLRLMTREQLSTAPYRDKSLPFVDQPGFLAEDYPPKRRSRRPTIGPHPIPQRQVEQLPSEQLRQLLIERYGRLGKAAQTKGLVEIKKSLLERYHSAMFVSSSREWHEMAQQMRGEITHLHAGLDGTIHAVLHPADCEKIMEAGWGQRHGFAGAPGMEKVVGFSLPVNYILIYAPRDAAELDIAIAIVQAAIKFMTGTREDLE